MTILLVEHHLLLAKPLLRGLEEEGLVAHLARNDAEADARVRSLSYDAVVVDGNVPRRGGIDLVRRWRHAGLAVPVLLFLPVTREADFRQATHAGADVVLPFPFSLEELLDHLRAWDEPLVEAAWSSWGLQPVGSA